MVLELHVWGPAFSLPSIDPQCLAAVAYVAQTVSRDQWVLIAGSEDAAGPASQSIRAIRADARSIQMHNADGTGYQKSYPL